MGLYQRSDKNCAFKYKGEFSYKHFFYIIMFSGWKTISFSAPYLNGVNAFVACLVCNSIKTILMVLECISLLFTCRVNLLPPVSFLLGNFIKILIVWPVLFLRDLSLLLNTWPVTLLLPRTSSALKQIKIHFLTPDHSSKLILLLGSLVLQIYCAPSLSTLICGLGHKLGFSH